jgi:hypothetical protein
MTPRERVLGALRFKDTRPVPYTPCDGGRNGAEPRNSPRNSLYEAALP